jgi:Domain of unknown function (DUF4262)
MTNPENETGDGGWADMGPLPAVPGCTCQICIPEAGYDEDQRNTIETVNRNGWEVMVINVQDQSGERVVACTVGLEHRLGHPELLVSGMPEDLMPVVLDMAAHRLMRGRRLAPGDWLEGVLGHVPVLVEELNQEGLRWTSFWSSWFHRRPVRVLQLLWPDTSGRFAWQPGAPSVLDDRQPSRWRIPVPHVGAFAPDPAWIFPAPAELLVVACNHIVEQGAAICFAQVENVIGKGEEWSFHCGELHGGAEDYALTHVSHIVRATPSLREVPGIRPNEYVWRDGPDGQWKRTSQGEYHPLDQYREAG